jgi:predicted TIM-barrel fold metal-dependent hydrolase
MLDPARQIAAMDERGVDVHMLLAILAVTPTGWASPAVALDLCRHYNDALAEAARAYPSRLVGSCILPLQDLPDLRIVVSHGGGYLPHYYGRLDRNVRNMPDSTVHISQPPSAYPAPAVLRHVRVRALDAQRAGAPGRPGPGAHGFRLAGGRRGPDRLRRALPGAR